MRRNFGFEAGLAARRQLRKERGFSPAREFFYGDGFLAGLGLALLALGLVAVVWGASG